MTKRERRYHQRMKWWKKSWKVLLKRRYYSINEFEKKLYRPYIPLIITPLQYDK